MADTIIHTNETVGRFFNKGSYSPQTLEELFLDMRSEPEGVVCRGDKEFPDAIYLPNTTLIKMDHSPDVRYIHSMECTTDGGLGQLKVTRNVLFYKDTLEPLHDSREDHYDYIRVPKEGYLAQLFLQEPFIMEGIQVRYVIDVSEIELLSSTIRDANQTIRTVYQFQDTIPEGIRKDLLQGLDYDAFCQRMLTRASREYKKG